MFCESIVAAAAKLCLLRREQRKRCDGGFVDVGALTTEYNDQPDVEQAHGEQTPLRRRKCRDGFSTAGVLKSRESPRRSSCVAGYGGRCRRCGRLR